MHCFMFSTTFFFFSFYNRFVSPLSLSLGAPCVMDDGCVRGETKKDFESSILYCRRKCDIYRSTDDDQATTKKRILKKEK